MKPIRVNVVIAPLKIRPDTLKPGLTPPQIYDRSTGILTVTLNLSVFANDFTSAVNALCLPQLFCQLSASKCVPSAMPPSVTRARIPTVPPAAASGFRLRFRQALWSVIRRPQTIAHW
jgi:hypothetical protein